MTMTTCHDGTAFTLPAESIVTSGGACTLPDTLLSSGTYQDTLGVGHSLYPLGYPAVWPDQHHHHHYPWYPTTTTELHTHVTAPAAEKPHETVARALKEIAQATRALKESAEAMGVPVEAAALDQALVARLHAALSQS